MTDFDPDWPHGHTTRDGRKARIICKDAEGPQPIVALVDFGGTKEVAQQFDRKGAYWLTSENAAQDLINAPAPKRKFVRWVNMYVAAGITATAHDSRDLANNAAASGRIACIRVEFEEGQFDE